MLINAAEINWLPDGRPYASKYDDIYLTDHHADGGIRDAFKFYIEPARIAHQANQKASLSVAELGFGSGLNFAACAAQVLHSSDCRLHYIGIEAHPLSATQSNRLHEATSTSLPAETGTIRTTQEIYRALHSPGHIPPLLSGWHRRYLEQGRIVLSIFHGDVGDALDELSNRQQIPIDAWLLDGFAPDKNPDMWQASNFQRMAQCSQPGTTVATFTAAAQVRRHLTAHGFKPEKIDQQPHKRESLAAVFIGNQASAENSHLLAKEFSAPKKVSILGAGIGGATLARQLAEQGVQVNLFDPNSRNSGGSKISTAIMHARLLGDASPTARLRAEAFHFSSNFYKRFRGIDACGVLQAEGPNLDANKMQRISQAFGAEDEDQQHWIHFLSAQQAQHRSHNHVQEAGLWFPTAGVINIPRLCADLLSHPNIAVFDNFHEQLIPDPAEPTILCCGSQARAYGHADNSLDWLEIVDVWGQLDHLHTAGKLSSTRLPEIAIVGNGYYAPTCGDEQNGYTLGATFEHTPWTQYAATEHNLKHNLRHNHEADTWAGCTRGIRAIASDREPVVGELNHNLWIASAYGSMGTTMAPLGAATIASHLLGWVPPIATSSEKLMHPLRFRERQARRGRRHI